MANDIIFKSKAFGGFDKNEVMDFVNKQLEEKSALEKRLSESNAKYAQVNAQLFEMKKANEETQADKQMLEETQNELSLVKQSLEEKTKECDDYLSVIAQKDAEIDALKQSLSEAVTSEAVQAELDSLRNEVARLKVEADKKRDLERQVGAAMLDARIHSEELVEEAKEKANAVTKSVYSAIGDTALKIDDLSTGIAEIARNFTKAAEEVELRIKALTGDMSKTAQLLISESGVISDTQEADAQIEYDFTSVDTPADFTINPADYGVNDVKTIEFTDSQDDI